MTYAITHYRLMDIKLVLKRSLVYLSTLMIIVIPVFGVRHIAALYFIKYIDWFDFAILVGAISVFTPIRNFNYRLANKYFFSSLYDSKEVITEIGDRLRSTLSVQTIYSSIYTTLNNAFHLKAFGVLSYDEENESYTLVYNRGFKVGKIKKFPGNPQLHKEFIKKIDQSFWRKLN